MQLSESVDVSEQHPLSMSYFPPPARLPAVNEDDIGVIVFWCKMKLPPRVLPMVIIPSGIMYSRTFPGISARMTCSVLKFIFVSLKTLGQTIEVPSLNVS